MSVFENAYKERPFLFGKIATEELLYVVDKFGIQGNALELGCGDGRDTYHILKRGLSVTAVDLSLSAITTLKNRRDLSIEDKERLNARCFDVINMDYENNKYDFVYAITLFDHLTKMQGELLLKKILPSLKNRGMLFLKVHTVDDVGFTHKSKEISEFASEIKHFYEHGELLSLMLPYGHVMYYLEANELDLDHGSPHTHAFASILIKKGESLL